MTPAIYDRERGRFVAAAGVWEPERALWEGTRDAPGPGKAAHRAHEAMMLVLWDLADSARVLASRSWLFAPLWTC